MISNDAGGANIVKEILKEINSSNILFSTSGPAKKIFEDVFYFKNESVDPVLSQVKTLLTTTSNPKVDLEHYARKKARDLNIKDISCRSLG